MEMDLSKVLRLRLNALKHSGRKSPSFGQMSKVDFMSQIQALIKGDKVKFFNHFTGHNKNGITWDKSQQNVDFCF